MSREGAHHAPHCNRETRKKVTDPVPEMTQASPLVEHARQERLVLTDRPQAL